LVADGITTLLDDPALLLLPGSTENGGSSVDRSRQGPPPVADIYQSIEELLAAERQFVQIENWIDGRSRIAVLAPHAGDIEPLTGEIARAVAGRDHRLYQFCGKAPANSFRLHVSSTRFDEAGLREVLNGARTAIAIHGTAGDEDAVTLIGGVNRTLADSIAHWLENAGFAVMPAPPRLAGSDPRNLVNRVPEGGVQLELTRRLRDDLRRGLLRKLRFDCYVEAIRGALAENELAPGPRWELLRTQSASPAA
jgi:phage replication-related protein YjqB (UPF0714/DUF867 family)